MIDRRPVFTFVWRIAASRLPFRQDQLATTSTKDVRGTRPWATQAPSGHSALVPVVQAANLCERNDPTGFRSLDRPWLRGILVQSEMRSTVVVIVHEATEVVAKATFSGDDHVIQAFTEDVPITRSM